MTCSARDFCGRTLAAPPGHHVPMVGGMPPKGGTTSSGGRSRFVPRTGRAGLSLAARFWSRHTKAQRVKRIERITLDEQGQGFVGQVAVAGLPEPLGNAECQRGGRRSVDARRQLVAFGQPGEHRLGILFDMLEDGLHLPPLGKAVQRSAERVAGFRHRPA